MGLFRRKTGEVSVQERIDPTPKTRSPILEPGVPGRCPECDGFGYIDHIDMINRTQSQHCRSCGHTWEFSFDDDLVDLTDDATDEADREQHTR